MSPHHFAHNVNDKHIDDKTTETQLGRSFSVQNEFQKLPTSLILIQNTRKQKKKMRALHSQSGHPEPRLIFPENPTPKKRHLSLFSSKKTSNLLKPITDTDPLDLSNEQKPKSHARKRPDDELQWKLYTTLSQQWPPRSNKRRRRCYIPKRRRILPGSWRRACLLHGRVKTLRL